MYKYFIENSDRESTVGNYKSLAKLFHPVKGGDPKVWQEITAEYRQIIASTPHVSSRFEVGAILVHDWGYEQTNIDFYCITYASTHYVHIKKMLVTSIDKGNMTTEVQPTTIDPKAPALKKQTKNYVIRFEHGGLCTLWNGKPQTATHYA